MPRYHKIKWRESDEKELRRVIKNFNSKLARLEKKNPQEYNKNTLPRFWDSKTETYTTRLSVRQMKELIKTRQDLNRELNALKRFSKKGSEKLVEIPNTDDNLKITKWQRTEMLRRVNFINKRRANRLKQIEETEVHQNNEPLGYTRGELGMGRIERKKFEPMAAFADSTDKYNVKARWKSIMKQSQHDYFNASDYRLRDNFLKAMTENYNPADVVDVVDAIKNMDIDEFLNKFYQDPDAWTWNYPPDREEYLTYLNQLKTDWLPGFGLVKE